MSRLCKVWEPLQVQATKSSNVAYTIQISSLEFLAIELCVMNDVMLCFVLFSLISVSSPFCLCCLSLCVLLCNDHLPLVWAEPNPDDDTPLLRRNWSLLTAVVVLGQILWSFNLMSSLGVFMHLLLPSRIFLGQNFGWLYQHYILMCIYNFQFYYLLCLIII